MVNGSESGEVVVSPIRAGMKREFAMLMKAQVECGISSGLRRVTRSQNVALSNEQRRVTRSQNVALNNGLSKSPGSSEKVKSSEAKKRKKEVKKLEFVEERGSKDREEKVPVSEEEEPKSDVVDGDEEGKGNVAKVGKEEAEVTDIMEKQGDEIEIENGGVKNEVEIESGVAKNEVETESNVVKEIINDDVKVIDNYETVNEEAKDDVVEPMLEELDMGIDKQEVELKRSSEGINAVETAIMGGEGSGENGVSEKPLRRFTRSALKQKEDAAETSGTGDIKSVEPVESDAVSPMTTPAKMEMKMSKKVESERSPMQMTDNTDRSSICVSDVKSSGQIASSIRRSKGQGRLTRKDVRLHKLAFEEDVLPDGTALAYYVRGEKLLEGYKKGFGIFCYCCENEVSPSQFEAHAGCASRRKPYQYIYTSNGVSLHELAIKLSKERKFSAEENDDLCSICADGGDLLCCDNCPRAFHAECVSLPSIPQGTWYCRYCQDMFQKEKFVEHNANAVAAGRVAGVDPLEQITKRCIRIVETLDADLCSCVLCRGNDFSKSGFGPRTVIICDQCEKEYHIGCLQEHNMDDLKELPKGKWFCCGECNAVHSALERLVADGEMKLSEVLLDMIKKKHSGKGSDDCPDLDIRWRLLRGKLVDEDTRKFLSGAVTLLHEQFDPIADASTSRLDLIPQMVYGRNFKDQDLGGMYTAILFVNSSVVSVGIIRIFGQELAELPLVATSSDYQGQGYFQCLFTCIENLLGSLNVRDLVLPSAEEAEAIWINKFGFEKITEEQLREYRKDHQMMIFQGTSALHKSVQKS